MMLPVQTNRKKKLEKVTLGAVDVQEFAAPASDGMRPVSKLISVAHQGPHLVSGCLFLPSG